MRQCTIIYIERLQKAHKDSYFEECCTFMRIYRTQQHQTPETNEKDNTQIVREMYTIFAKENVRAAGTQKGEKF